MRSSIVLAVAVALAPIALAEDHPASWKPDASDLLFTSGRDGNAEVFVLRKGQKEWTNLTNDKASDNWPIWSPDGSRILFQSNRTGNLDIWVMKADGSEPVQLTKDTEPDYLASWSPDGKTIVFTSWRIENAETRSPHIYVMNADGSGQRRLIAQSTNTSEGAAFSSDGKRIVFARKPGEKGADIVVADADGKNEKQITNDHEKDVYNGTPAFSPDGKWIAFYSDDTKASALVVMDVEGKQRRTVLAEGKNWYPHWSPDSQWLVYTAAVETGDKGNTDIYGIRVSGNEKPVLLIGSAKRDLEGSWSPKK